MGMSVGVAWLQVAGVCPLAAVSREGGYRVEWMPAMWCTVFLAVRGALLVWYYLEKQATGWALESGASISARIGEFVFVDAMQLSSYCCSVMLLLATRRLARLLPEMATLGKMLAAVSSSECWSPGPLTLVYTCVTLRVDRHQVHMLHHRQVGEQRLVGGGAAPPPAGSTRLAFLLRCHVPTDQCARPPAHRCTDCSSSPLGAAPGPGEGGEHTLPTLARVNLHSARQPPHGSHGPHCLGPGTLPEALSRLVAADRGGSGAPDGVFRSGAAGHCNDQRPQLHLLRVLQLPEVERWLH